jgi:activator of 2-hydroxyglutaryl-CoA dehydratase
MAGRICLVPPIMMTGGVAQNSGVVRSLEKKIGHCLVVTPNAQFTGAIGAALIAMNP